MFTKLIDAELECEDGEKRKLDDIEIAGFATLLGGAGAETVTKLVGNAPVVFARNPEQWQKLLDDRSKIPAAVEELLRYEAPSQYQVRRSMKDVYLHGVTIPAGKPMFLINGAANRDPEAWTDPDKFDIDRDRTEAQNMGFGYGIHSCLGAALARMESASRAGEAARLHAALRGGLARVPTRPDAKRDGLEARTGEGSSVRIPK